jgi:divalent metal cation (Fe/Co/Zn/Cd) transporter
METAAQPVTRLYQTALWLAFFTVGYNLLEGVVSIAFGISDETLTLFGFGVDSFIEALSGIGIVAMILRIRQNPDVPKSEFEKTALTITGWSFYLLAIGLTLTAAVNIFTGHKPETTLPGAIIAIISIAIMYWLVREKTKVGKALNSEPILADASCTKVCIMMSIVLLASSFIYAITGFGFVDSLGALGLTYYAINEGREAFEKAKGIDACACHDA